MNYELLGKRIRAARRKAGLSQEALAEKVGLSSQHISHTENNYTKISLPALVDIANALHTSVDQLLSDSLQEVKPHLLNDVQNVFSDCSTDELHIMLETATAVKNALRSRNLKHLD